MTTTTTTTRTTPTPHRPGNMQSFRSGWCLATRETRQSSVCLLRMVRASNIQLVDDALTRNIVSIVLHVFRHFSIHFKNGNIFICKFNVFIIWLPDWLLHNLFHQLHYYHYNIVSLSNYLYLVFGSLRNKIISTTTTTTKIIISFQKQDSQNL